VKEYVVTLTAGERGQLGGMASAGRAAARRLVRIEPAPVFGDGRSAFPKLPQLRLCRPGRRV
jgi:hypothetical protein